MLEKKITYDHTIDEDGCINVRRITRILEDGQEFSKAYHRHIVSPGDDVTDQDERTIKLAEVIHMPDVIAAFALKRKKEFEGMKRD